MIHHRQYCRDNSYADTTSQPGPSNTHTLDSTHLSLEILWTQIHLPSDNEIAAQSVEQTATFQDSLERHT
jgi:hypothetical protein